MHNAMVKVMDPNAALDDEALVGNEGTIRILSFDNSTEEAESLAGMIKGWIEDDGIAPAEIAILGSRTPGAYAEKLSSVLESEGIALRNEQNAQDFYTEPIIRRRPQHVTHIRTPAHAANGAKRCRSVARK